MTFICSQCSHFNWKYSNYNFSLNDNRYCNRVRYITGWLRSIKLFNCMSSNIIDIDFDFITSLFLVFVFLSSFILCIWFMLLFLKKSLKKNLQHNICAEHICNLQYLISIELIEHWIYSMMVSLQLNFFMKIIANYINAITHLVSIILKLRRWA